MRSPRCSARNASIQEEFGAPPEKISIVPNGVSRELLGYPLPAREHRRKPTVGFLGRIVQIKDVKSLLRAAATVTRDIPDAQFLIAEPTEEEPAYFHSCVELACSLGISDQGRLCRHGRGCPHFCARST